MKQLLKPTTGTLIAAGTAACLLCASTAAPAQHIDPQNNGYQIGETSQSQQPAPAAPSAGAVRLARIEYVTGNVTWRPDGGANWSAAKQNTALRPGAQIWAVGNGRAEIRFEDGGIIRIGHGAVAIIDTMYSDAQGPFTKVEINSGLAFLSMKAGPAVYQMDLPTTSVVASGPARIRIGAQNGSDIAVRQGKAVVTGKQAKPAKITVNSGDFLAVTGTDSTMAVKRLPPPDSWDRWNDERDHVPDGYPHFHSAPGYGPVIIFGGGWRHRW